MEELCSINALENNYKFIPKKKDNTGTDLIINTGTDLVIITGNDYIDNTVSPPSALILIVFLVTFFFSKKVT